MHVAATPAAHVVVAKPEVQTTVAVGDVLILPLYDAKPSARVAGDAVRFLRIERIDDHDLWSDTSFKAFGAAQMPRAVYDAASNRGEAFLAQKSGMSTVLIYLTLPRLTELCVDCRVVHYFIRVVGTHKKP